MSWPVTSTFRRVVMLLLLALFAIRGTSAFESIIIPLLISLSGVIAGEYTVFSRAFASYSNVIMPGVVNATGSKITVTAHIQRLQLLDVVCVFDLPYSS